MEAEIQTQLSYKFEFDISGMLFQIKRKQSFSVKSSVVMKKFSCTGVNFNEPCLIYNFL